MRLAIEKELSGTSRRSFRSTACNARPWLTGHGKAAAALSSKWRLKLTSPVASFSWATHRRTE